MVETLFTEHLDTWSSAIKAKSSAGRGNSKKRKLYGVQKLRDLILELAVRGLIVPQDSNDEPAAEHLKKIAAKKTQLLKAGKIKKQKALPAVSEDEIQFPLPEGWQWEKLGNLVEMYNGRAFKSSEWGNDGLPIVRIQNLNDEYAAFNYFSGELSENNRIADGTFLISWSGTPGTSFGAFIWKRGEAALNQHINKCVFHHNEIDLEFMKLVVTGQMNHFISKAQGGVGLKHVTKGTLNNAVLGIPPLSEQHRIVAKVDELMALCDQLEQQQEDSLRTHQTLVQTLLGALAAASERGQFNEAWKRIESNFDTLFTTESSIDELKQTILQLAVMGKIVHQDSNDEPASALLAKIAANEAQLTKDGEIKKRIHVSPIRPEEKPFTIPTRWKWIRLNTVINPLREISYGIIKLEKEPVSGGIPTLRCSDVKPRHLDLSSVRTVDPEVETPYKRTRLEGGEVVLNIRGTLGGVAWVPESLAGYNIAREVAMLAFQEGIVGMFAVNLIASPYFWKMIETNLKGIAYKGLNLKILRELPIPLPPVEEQERIVAKVDQLMAICDQLKVSLKTAQATQLNLADSLVEEALK